MPQNRDSGIRGNEFGKYVANRLAEVLNITIEEKSNKSVYLGEDVLLRAAGTFSSNFGITKSMLSRVSSVILARQRSPACKFEVYLVKLGDLEHRRDSRSKGSQGRTVIFRVSEAIQKGRKLDEVEIHVPF